MSSRVSLGRVFRPGIFVARVSSGGQFVENLVLK
jgi:hypothetical protein